MNRLFSAWLPRPVRSAAELFPALHLTGDRIVVRPPHPDDEDLWIELRRASRAHLVPFEPAWPAEALTPEFFRNRIANQARDWRLGLSCCFLIFRHSGEMIGGVNLNNIVRGAGQYCTLGYWLGAQWQGQGYMQEALKITMAYGFDHLNLHRINAATLTHNGRSIKLLRRLGFEEEGFAKSYLQINGEWQDHILFGMTEAMFAEKSGILV